MAHLQYMPGDTRLVDQLVYELKSKGIFDQFRKECIADVDTRPAYQNLRQRVENSVTTFLSRQSWKQDLNKNQLREKLRKHILDGNYLEQGVERIVDQVVNPKVASVFIPQVEDLVYNYLGITRKKATPSAEISTDQTATNLLPTDLEAVSPGSVKSNEGKDMVDEIERKEELMDIDDEFKETKEESLLSIESEKEKEKLQTQDTAEQVGLGVNESTRESEMSIDKSTIPLPEEIKPENIPPPENSPPKLDLGKIELPKTPEEYAHLPENPTEIPLPIDGPIGKDQYFKAIDPNSDDDSSSDSSLRRNMSPLTPVRNFNTENSCDAQQAFDNDSDSKNDLKKEPSSFRFAIDSKSTENILDDSQMKKKDSEQGSLAYQFNNQINIHTFNTPLYADSSNSYNLQIDYESDANSKTIVENKVPETDNSEDSKKDRKSSDKQSSQKSSHRSRDAHRHSSSKDKKSDSKQSSSRDGSRHDRKSKEDQNKSKSVSHKEGERPKEKDDKKESRDSSKHRSSHRSSSSQKDSKSNRSLSSSQKSLSKNSDDKKSSSSHKEKSERSSDKSKEKKDSKSGSHDSKSSSHRSEKDKKSSSKSKHDEKDKKKDKKESDDHYSLSGRGNPNRRSTDRDSNDGSSSSKGSHNPTSFKSSESKKESKDSSTKSENTSSSDSTSPNDKEHKVVNSTYEAKSMNIKPIVRVETQLEVPKTSPPRLPFVPDITLKKPKFAANLEEAKKMMKMRKFLDEEQKRMNQEAALLLEFQANVRPSLSQAYSSISGPELEFACVTHLPETVVENEVRYEMAQIDNIEDQNVAIQDQTRDSIIENDPSEAGSVSNINDHIEGACLHNQNIDSSDLKTDVEEKIDQTCEATNISDTNVNANKKDTEIEVVHDLQPDEKLNETYEENKPFSKLVEEITEYSKASERLKLIDKPNTDVAETANRSNMFEVTIITEELSENEESVEEKIYEEAIKDCPDEEIFNYFADDEKHDAELKQLVFSSFFKKISENLKSSNTIHLINCNTYEENIFRDVCKKFGDYEIYNYYKNGHLKLPTARNIKNLDLQTEVTLPEDKVYKPPVSRSPVFSPVKSECSFDLSSDYDAKLEEMVNRTSKQEVLEIILGGVIDETSSEMPKIDYCNDSNIIGNSPIKRKVNEIQSTVNNNILTPNKIRKLSESDQISSTTEETDEGSNNNIIQVNTRSKYLGRAKRVGLPRPKKSNQPNSPSSDKSVENYEHNSTPQTPNGKLKTPQRTKIQRYDTSDLYKPKLHYLSRRNNIS